MPRKIRELVQDLKRSGFELVEGGKGSHLKFVHRFFRGAVTLSGSLSDDAKPYQEKQVHQAIEETRDDKS